MPRDPQAEPSDVVPAMSAVSSVHTADGDSPNVRDIEALLRLQSGSPPSRSGLLGPRSYLTASPRPSHPGRASFALHSQNTIRNNTMEISSIPLSSRSSTEAAHSEDADTEAFIFPDLAASPPHAHATDLPPESVASSVISLRHAEDASDLEASTSTLSTQGAGAVTPRAPSGLHQPSALSLLLARHDEEVRLGAPSPIIECQEPTPTAERPAWMARTLSTVREQSVASRAVSQPEEETAHAPSDENVPLLADVEANHRTYHTNGDSRPEPIGKRSTRGVVKDFGYRIAKQSGPVAKDAVKSIPAAILGTLLNILDGISYGMIIFPASGVFDHLGGVGVSMFFVTTVVSQLIYSSGASGFVGANGSMMIEVVPFFHLIANGIAEEMGEDNPRAVIATTMAAYAFSSILTGLSFFMLGALRLGTLIGFFPRHILVGCIGGVGVFLVITGLTVSTRMSDDDFALDLATFKYLFLNVGNLVLWLPAFCLAALLRVITHKWEHQLIFPIYFCIIPAMFYIVVAAAGIDLPRLRAAGWLFDMGTSQEPWWHFYTLFAVSLDHDVNTDRELVAHGYSNFFAGLLGTVPNYLVYVNTLLFYRVGGETRVSGFMLAGTTTLLLLLGTGPIAFIPVMVVGALIFVLGIDLVKEALWDTRHRVSLTEYITIASIMVVMTVWDFVIGVLFGIIASCFFFVIHSSQRHSIRALYSGDSIMSTVRRPGAHRAYLHEASKQTTIVRLQGFMFFGTITQVEESIRQLFEEHAWHKTPIRFLVLDLALVAGVDLSAAEAFVRVQRLLASKRVVLVLCGFTVRSDIGRALTNVGLLEMPGVELFETFSDAMEWTENMYLRAWFTAQKTEVLPVTLPGRQDDVIPFSGSVVESPRRAALLTAGWRTIARDHSARDELPAPEPFNTLVRAFSPYEHIDRETYAPLIPYLHRMSVPEGTVLWTQDQPPDGLYIVESGILRATYYFAHPTPSMVETMVPGTIAGELSMLSGLERNATCVVERAAVLWKLSAESLAQLQQRNPELARAFTKLILKVAKLDYDVLITALATRH
uniref:Fe(2+) transporter 3 n=1 Tax=Ganoderma boninense TaxID=34458 RepID=A0A5K1K1L9_9APHY|nr:Fe(2+) transporter 3 [Ganoderma boninense]